MPRIEIDLSNPHSFSSQNPIQSANLTFKQCNQSNILMVIFIVAAKSELSYQFYRQKTQYWPCNKWNPRERRIVPGH